MPFFKKNIDFIGQHCPELVQLLGHSNGECYPLVEGKKGHPNVKVNGKWVHSQYDPFKEFSSWTQVPPGKSIIVIGLGLGYGLKDMPVDHSDLIFIFEPDKKLLVSALHSNPLFDWLKGKSFRLFWDTASFLTEVEESCAGETDFQMLILPFYGRHPSPVIKSVVNQVKMRLEQLAFQRQTYLHRIDQILFSTLRSLPFALNSFPFQDLIGTMRDVPVVICSSGPSLEKNLHEIIPYRSRLILVSLGRSLPVLKSVGLIPDFVVQIEFQDFSSWLDGFPGLETSRFLLPFQCHETFFRFPAFAHYVYQTPHNSFLKWLNDCFPELKQEEFESGGSVAHDALNLALAMGANPIILIGQDLAVDTSWFEAQNKHLPDARKDLREIQGYFQTPVDSPGSYRQFLHWFERKAESLKPGQCVWNATEGGASIHGFPRISLRHALASFVSCRPEIDLLAHLPHSEPLCSRAVSQEKWHHQMEGVASALKRIGEINESVLIHLSNGGDGHQPPNCSLHWQDQTFKTLGMQIPFFSGFLQKELAQVSEGNGPLSETWEVVHSASLKAVRQLIPLIEDLRKVFLRK